MDERMWIVVRRRVTVVTLHDDETWRTGLPKKCFKTGKGKGVFSEGKENCFKKWKGRRVVGFKKRTLAKTRSALRGGLSPACRTQTPKPENTTLLWFFPPLLPSHHLSRPFTARPTATQVRFRRVKPVRRNAAVRESSRLQNWLNMEDN